MMQAIQTRYFGPGNVKGSRIKAWCVAGSVTIDYPHEVGTGQPAHRLAAEALRDKLGWNTPRYGRLLGACLPNGDHCFIFDNDAAKE